MESVIKTMGSKGEIVLPKSARNKLNLKKDSKLKISLVKNSLVVTPINDDFSEVVGILKGSGMSLKKLDELAIELMYGG